MLKELLEFSEDGSTPALTDGAAEKKEVLTGLELALVVVMEPVFHATKMVSLMWMEIPLDFQA